jgi:SprT protein
MNNTITNIVKKTLKKAETTYGRSFPEIEIRNDIKGNCGGQFCVRGTHKYLRFNPVLWSENKDTYDHTVVHEVAHYVQKELYPMSKPHGREWKSVMTKLGAKPSRTHAMNIRSTQKRTFVYSCDCMDHDLSIIQHNKCRTKGSIYSCNVCHSDLVFKREVL